MTPETRRPGNGTRGAGAVLVALLAAGCAPMLPPPDRIEPPPVWEATDPLPPRTVRPETDPPPFRPLSMLGEAAIAAFQRHASPYDGSSCPFDPSCSHYARIACARHGVPRGAVLAAGRLMRCHGHGMRAYPPRARTWDGPWLFDDPVPGTEAPR